MVRANIRSIVSRLSAWCSSSQGEDPFWGKTSGHQILARVSDDGLNYLRLQFNAYVGNPDDPALQLFYCVGGVETRLWWKDIGPVPGSGAVLTLLAGLKGYKRAHAPSSSTTTSSMRSPRLDPYHGAPLNTFHDGLGSRHDGG